MLRTTDNPVGGTRCGRQAGMTSGVGMAVPGDEQPRVSVRGRTPMGPELGLPCSTWCNCCLNSKCHHYLSITILFVGCYRRHDCLKDELWRLVMKNASNKGSYPSTRKLEIWGHILDLVKADLYCIQWRYTGLPEVQSLTKISFLERLGMMVRGVGSKETKIKKAPEQIAVVISILNLLSH